MHQGHLYLTDITVLVQLLVRYVSLLDFKHFRYSGVNLCVRQHKPP